MRMEVLWFSPPKKPDAMYPDDGPPPRRSITYVTIHPDRASSASTTQSAEHALTSDRDLDPNVIENEDREEVQRAQAEDLFVLPSLSRRFRRRVAQFRETF